MDNNASTVFGPFSGHLGELMDKKSFSSVFILCDSNTRVHCEVVSRAMPKEYQASIIEMMPGEESKTLETCESVWEELANSGADRNSLLINLGGGVVTDLGGFCAASFMRGMPFVHIPTSVLAMTDAAIGGKVGVDFKGYKNYIGAFAKAEKIIVDAAFIDTLPDVQKRNGLAEVIKHACLVSEDEITMMLGMPGVEGIDWYDLVERSARVKLDIVRQDRNDRGIRGALNFGHTIGHAIESYSLTTEQPMHHGEAVALGMLVESRMSSQFRNLDERHLMLIEKLVKKYFSDVKFPDLDLEGLWHFMHKDKKKSGENVIFSLLDAPGTPSVGQVVPESMVNEAYLHYAKM